MINPFTDHTLDMIRNRLQGYERELLWDDDPWDKEHTRKMKLLGQARIRVDAPFHPDFSPCTQLTLARLVGNGDSHLASRLINGSRLDND